MTNGGFIHFYCNGYRKYLAPIKAGLILIVDSNMLQLVTKADHEYLLYQNVFEEYQKKDDWSPLYDKLRKFDEYDSLYYKLHDQTMNLLEKYARGNPQEFVRLK
jgi:hypothetical protein